MRGLTLSAVSPFEHKAMEIFPNPKSEKEPNLWFWRKLNNSMCFAKISYLCLQDGSYVHISSQQQQQEQQIDKSKKIHEKSFKCLTSGF